MTGQPLLNRHYVGGNPDRVVRKQQQARAEKGKAKVKGKEAKAKERAPTAKEASQQTTGMPCLTIGGERASGVAQRQAEKWKAIVH